ncbi:hypothetical protein ASD04_15030 [Devosia sp. Root436]|uniref:hypothetical protein n=1 Tax=Devosia sp. Root436 TaxID=1736537 RepID=UPI0006FAA21F|nr:hypothetical protein [Devosia sp. Root436]KQX35351.1 hypothetical protein ASD04_15030 [Devosia sp. Root436]
MNGQWIKVAAPLPYEHGHAWGGLLIVDAYDMEDGLFFPDQFEIRHLASAEYMLEVTAPFERVKEIATDLANIADWAAMSTTDETLLQAKLMAFSAGYPGEVALFTDWAMPDEMDLIVPYGGH